MKSLLVIGITILVLSCTEQPSFVNFTYPEGKYKALVLSYDDGTIQDIELTQLFDQNNLIGTFNLNSGYLGVTRGWPQQNGDTIYQKYVPKDSLLVVYKKHEIAAHGEFHKNFTDISIEDVLKEVTTDIKILKEITNREIISLAYPFGNTNEEIAEAISKTDILNGRTVADTYRFDLPENYLIWNPTCHDSKALEFLPTYIELDQQELSLFYVWGHSWEFGDQQRWDNMVKFCEEAGKVSDIWSVGNGELTQYLQAIEKVRIENNRISNPQDNLMVWIELSNGIERLEAGETIEIEP